MLANLTTKQLVRLRRARLERFARLNDLVGFRNDTCTIIALQIDRINHELHQRGVKVRRYATLPSTLYN